MYNKAWNWLKKSWLLVWGSTQGSRTLIVGFLFFITFFLGVSGTLDSFWEDSSYEDDEVTLTLEMEEAIEEDANELAATDEADEMEQEAVEEKSFLDEAAAKAKLLASGMVDATGKVVNSFGEAIGGFFSYKLPNGFEIQIPEGGLEEKFLKALESDTGDKDYFVFDRIYFKTGSSVINKSSDDQIDSTVSILKAFSDKTILLRGHTDSIGNKNFNTKLSMKRANSLKTILVNRGISVDRIKVDGLGSIEPLARNNTAKGRLQNRRIDISVVK